MATDHDASGAPSDEAHQDEHRDDLGRAPGTSPRDVSASSPRDVHGSDPGSSPDDDPRTAQAADDDRPTGERSSTDQPTGINQPTGTAPRAVLRPVPEGFPTPPPRPARPNRAPALPSPEPEPPRRPRYLMAVLIGIAVLALVIGIVGGVIAVRALSGNDNASPAGPGASDGPTAGTGDPTAGTGDPTAGPGGQATIGEVTVTEVSTESGLTEVTGDGTTMQPTGQFVVIVVELDNASDRTVIINNASLQLETTDGEVHPADPDASAILDAPTDPRGVADVQDSIRVHAVFDIPEGAEPGSVHIDLSGAHSAGSGELPLGG